MAWITLASDYELLTLQGGSYFRALSLSCSFLTFWDYELTFYFYFSNTGFTQETARGRKAGEGDARRVRYIENERRGERNREASVSVLRALTIHTRADIVCMMKFAFTYITPFTGLVHCNCH